MSEVVEEHLPRGWVQASLADVVEPRRGKANPQRMPHAQFITMESVEAHSMRLIGTVSSSSMKSAANVFLPSDVLYGRLRSYLNKVYQPTFAGLCSSEFIVLPESTAILGSFLKYRLNAGDFVRFATRINTGDRPRVDFDQIKVFPICLPPTPEQQRISAALDELFSDLDEGVAALKRVQQNLKLYRASVLKAAVEGDLTAEWRAQHPDVEPASELLKRILVERRRRWEEDQLRKIKEKGQEPPTNWKSKYREPSPIEPGALPAILPNWVYASAESICASVRDGTHDTPTYVSEGIPLVTSKNLLQSGIDFENVKMISAQDHAEISKRSGVQQGDILFAMIGTVGNPVIVDTERAFSIKNVGLFKANIQFVNPRYLRVWFLCPEFKEWLEGKQKGTTQKFVPLGLLRALPVALPPLCEQEAIIEAVEGQVSIIDHLEVEIETKLKSAQALRQAILRHAFTGKLVPQDPNDEPASELLKRIAAKREARARDTTSTKWATKSGTRPYAARSRRYKEKRTKDN